MREDILSRLSLRLIRMVQTGESDVDELLNALSKAVKAGGADGKIEEISDQLVKRVMLKTDTASVQAPPANFDISGLGALVHELPIDRRQKSKLETLVRDIVGTDSQSKRQQLLRELLDIVKLPRLEPRSKSDSGGGLRGWLGKTGAKSSETMEQYATQLASLLERLCHHIDVMNGNEQETVAFKTQLKSFQALESSSNLIDIVTKEIDEIDRRILAERNQASEFLGDLRKRLTGFEKVFSAMGAAGEESMQRAESLQADVSVEVEGIGKAVAEHENPAVQGGLREITLKLAGYIADEKNQHEQTKGALDDLTKKLAVLERETDSLRNEIRAKEDLALKDALTGIYNRAGYDARMQEMFERCSRTGSDMCIVFVDCDEFKRINDQFGHHAGDVVLVKVAESLQQRARSSDIVARFGGDEFVVLLADAQLDGARLFAEDVCRKISDAGFNNNGELLDVSISCGVAQLKNGENADALVKRADEAMYQAKKLSGLRVVAN